MSVGRWCPVEIPTWLQLFSLIFVRIHINEFIQLIYKLYSTNSYMVWFLYQFIQLFYELYSTNSYKMLFFFLSLRKPRGQSPSRKRAAQAARGEAWAHLLPRPGRTRLPRPLGYTRLPWPVRVRSWGGWVRNGIKVYDLYYQLPRPLGYTRLPWPLGYTRVARAASTQRKLRGAKPDHTSCPDQAAPSCPDH